MKTAMEIVEQIILEEIKDKTVQLNKRLNLYMTDNSQALIKEDWHISVSPEWIVERFGWIVVIADMSSDKRHIFGWYDNALFERIREVIK